MLNSNSSCLVGTQPLILQEQNSCSLGFFCPNISAGNPPQYCPPTIQCQITRLSQTASTCQEPQGTYEPIVCAPGYYCPSGGKTKVICPPNHYCPLGAFRPIQCSYRSICPSNSQRQIEMVGLIAIIAIDIFLSLWKFGPRLRTLYRRRWRKKPANLSSLENAIEKTPPGPGAIASDKPDLSPDEIHVLQDSAIELHGEQVSDADFKNFIQSLEKAIGTNRFGLSFSFIDLGLKLTDSCHEILKGITGHIESGSMWGILGASGAGKSTFLNILMGHVMSTSGNIYVNGVEKGIAGYKKIIGYVPQDDVVLPNLTVRENILHSARVRLLASWSETQIQAHVDALIACLKLSHVQHSRVGDSINPVISGGQRKRVSIGIELAAAPMALFLDEPTSGLDATSALSVMRLLKALSKIGVTVVSIIHQPRTEIYYCLDNVLLLSGGQQLYQGNAIDALSYFTRLGFVFRSDFNPADIIMDIINGQGQKYQRCPPTGRKVSLTEEWISYQTANEPQFNLQDRVKRDEQEVFLQKIITLRGASWLKQAFFCFSRSLLQQAREVTDFLLEVAVGGASGVLIGLSVFQLRGLLFVGMYRSPYEILSSAANYTLVPQLGLLCALAIGAMTGIHSYGVILSSHLGLAGSAAGVRVFGDEKQMFHREAFAGHSRSAYYIGKVLSTFFRIALSSLHFTVFYALLATPIMSFGRLYIANMLYYYCIYGLASCVSMVASRENGPLLSVMLSLITGIFSGYGPSLATVRKWRLEWFWRICPGTWFAEAYVTDHLDPLSYLYDIEVAARWTGYNLHSYAFDISMLLVIGTVYRLIAYGGLLYWKPRKQ